MNISTIDNYNRKKNQNRPPFILIFDYICFFLSVVLIVYVKPYSRSFNNACPLFIVFYMMTWLLWVRSMTFVFHLFKRLILTFSKGLSVLNFHLNLVFSVFDFLYLLFKILMFNLHPEFCTNQQVKKKENYCYYWR